MNKLLVSNFARLFGSRLFKICVVLLVLLACTADVSRAIDIHKHPEFYADLPEYRSADCFVLAGSLYLVFVIPVLVGSFIGTEYSDGTIRNKLFIGQTRFGIYVSNFIVSTTASMMLHFVYSATALCVGLIVLEPLGISLKELLFRLFMQMIPIIAFSALMTLITMLIQNKAVGSVTVILVSCMMLFTALTIADKLKAPEYREYYSVTSVDPETGDEKYDMITEKNPYYLTGNKRRILEALNDILPVNQLSQISNTNEAIDDYGMMIVCSAIWTVLINGAGIVAFCKKDLK